MTECDIPIAFMDMIKSTSSRRILIHWHLSKLYVMRIQGLCSVTVIGNAFQLMQICIDNKDDPFVSTMFVRSIDGEFFAKSFSEN